MQEKDKDGTDLFVVPSGRAKAESRRSPVLFAVLSATILSTLPSSPFSCVFRRGLVSHTETRREEEEP